jgi:phosphatidylglycerophosphatase C
VSAPFPATPPAGIALFDLDGTLIAWDCQLLFRHFVLRKEPLRGLSLPLFLAVAPFAKLLGAARMKRVFLSYLWRMPEEKLAAYSREFARAVVPAIYPELLKELHRLRERGDFLILASASPEFYVTEIGRELGFDLSLGTPVQTGPLLPPLHNHKGAAKVERLKEILPATWFHDGILKDCHGFTDSPADLPMLSLCSAATLVNPGFALTEVGNQSGWHIVRPARPWKSPLGFAWRALALLLGLGREPGGLEPRQG